MDAIVTAGGIPLPDEALYAYSKGDPKALMQIAGKPMIQWVLDALSGARTIENVVIVGISPKSKVTCKKPVTFVPNQGKMLDNLQAGMDALRAIRPQKGHFLFVSSDIPTITSEMVDWVVSTCMETDDDIYYNVITRATMEKTFPGSNRTYTRLKDMDICGGDMNVARSSLVAEDSELWEKIFNARKSPLKQAALIGFGTLLGLVTRRLTLDDVVERVTDRLDLTGRAVICPYAEIGMDIDKPHQFDLVERKLKRTLRAAERSREIAKAKTAGKKAPKKPAAKASAKKAPVKKAAAKKAPVRKTAKKAAK